MKGLSRVLFLIFYGLIAVLPCIAEDTPFFIGEHYYPNAFIIFDNSASMQDVPFTNPGGVAVRPEDKGWKYDVMDENGNPYRDKRGFLQWRERPDRAGDDRLATGGHHPASKLYQAKKALNEILRTIEHVNLGFATYLSERHPRTAAKYVKIDTGYTVPETSTTVNYPTRWQFLAWRERRMSRSVLQPWPDRFTWYGTHYGGPGDTFERLWTDGDVQGSDCSLRVQKIRFTIDSVTEEYGDDGEFHGYRWRFGAPYRDYRFRTIEDDGYDEGCAAGQGWNQCDPEALPARVGTWYRATDGSDCRLWRKLPAKSVTKVHPAKTVPDIYRFTWLVTTGNWGARQGETGYIDPQTYEVTPRSSVGSWELLESTLTDVVINTAGKRETHAPGRYPDDIFSYPGEGTKERPHAWSYVRMSEKSNGGWPDSIQPDPFFPDQAVLESEVATDNHILFVHLPRENSNDVSLSHRDRILELVSLERFAGHPGHPDHDFTAMPFTTSVPPNTETAIYGRATPLAASLRYARRYYESYIQKDAQSRDQCRENYVVLLTDGLDTADCDPTVGYEECTAPMEAARALRQIPAADGSYQVRTFVVGFGLEEGQKAYLDAIAESGGTDAPGDHNAYFADNVEGLTEALSKIFQGITSGRYSRADLAISREGDRLYTAYFSYPHWAGHLRAFKIRSDGSVGEEVSTWGHQAPCPFQPTPTNPSPCLGDAGSSVNQQPSRRIFTTVDNRDLIALSYSAISGRIEYPGGSLPAKLKTLLIEPGDDIDGDGIPNEDEDAETVLSFTLNPGYDNGRYKGTRNPRWKLPDLYHSSPVLVGPPPFRVRDAGYQEFKEMKAGRDTLVLIGGNGGMLHAFNAGTFNEEGEVVDADGAERWAFIPRMALGRLKELREEHGFFVDAKPAVADIFSEGGHGTVFPKAPEPKYGWHTVVVSGMRDGGRGYFALDVTDPDNPIMLWELSQKNMGYTWSTPAIGKVRVGDRDKWVAIAGGGWYPEGKDIGNRLYVIDIEKGAILAEFSVGSSENRIPSAVRDVDLDRDGYIERLYFGDTEGVLWRMDTTSAKISKWTPRVFFDPEKYDFGSWDLEDLPARRPIYYPPAVARGEGGNDIVLLGTGDEHSPNTTDTQDWFYEIASADGQGSDPGEDPMSTVSWIHRLDPGEKMLSRPSVFDDIVYFTTYMPSFGCEAGRAYLYGLTVSRGIHGKGGGEAGIKYDALGNPLDPPAQRVLIGSGAPSSPIVTNGHVYATSSNHAGERGSIRVQKIDPVSGVLRSWREIF